MILRHFSTSHLVNTGPDDQAFGLFGRHVSYLDDLDREGNESSSTMKTVAVERDV
jgi:hypothetical protein